MGSGAWVVTMTVLAAIASLVPDISNDVRIAASVILVLLGIAAVSALRREREESQRQYGDVVQRLDELKNLPPAKASSEDRLQAIAAIPLTSLKHKAISLSDDILRFLVVRQAGEPPLPRPATWHEDADAMTRYSGETRNVYSQKFGSKVIATYNMLSDAGLRDSELDRFYEHPTNPIGMRIVAERIGALAERLPDV